MITIESIRLRNFRSIREAYFKPLHKGISVIMGSNGAGKTTLLAGLLFALYGIRPPGSSIANLRRKASKVDEECSVSVVFKHMGQDVEVIREIKGNNNRVILNIFVDGAETTVTSVSSGDAWIRQRLGIDANSFLTAFAVRQKELDSLVNATPAVRKLIIEKLAGIEVINEALKSARKNENDAKSTLETLPGSQLAVEEGESQVLFLNEKVEDLTKTSIKIKANLDDQVTKEKKIEEELRALRQSETLLIRDRNQLELLQENDKSNQESLHRLKYLDEVKEDQDIESLRTRHKELTAAVSEKRQSYTESVIRRDSALDKNKNLLEDIKDLEKFTKEAKTRLKDKDSLTLFKAKEVRESENQALFNDITQSQGRENDLKESVQLLAHSTECPTCHTHLDDPEKLIKSLTKTANLLAEEISKKEIALIESRGEVESMVTLLEDLENFHNKEAQLDLLKKEREDLLKNLTPEETLEEWLQEITLLEEERTSVTEIGQRLANLKEDKALKTELTRKINEASNTLAELNTRIKETLKTFSPQKLDQVEKNFNALNSERTRLNEAWTNVNSELASFKSRLVIANNTYKSVTEQWKRKKELLKAQETNGLTTALLDKFRRETIASLTPELSENASELITEITSGAYTEVNVDDDFNISVLNSLGDSRTVGELSGGEESAVALALRLAIGLLITGRNPEFLWLDEVLTSQDTDRRSSMLDTIRSLPYKQIIMVSHTSDAGEIADLSVTVVPDLKTGSTLEITSDIGLEDPAITEDLDEEIQEST